jgi:hypothetical protein
MDLAAIRNDAKRTIKELDSAFWNGTWFASSQPRQRAWRTRRDMTDGPERNGSASALELALLRNRVLLNEGTDKDRARLPPGRAMRRHLALLHANL